MKMINIKGIVILAVILAAVHFISGLVISPMLAPKIVEVINKTTEAKISIDKINIWPLTLSFSLKGLKIFNPDNTGERIAMVDKTSVNISPIGLLSKKVIISSLTVSGADMEVKEDKRGNFNIEKIAPKKDTAKKEGPGLMERLKGQKDLFGRIYNIIKSQSSKKAAEKEKETLRKAKEVKKSVVELPEGRRVEFKTLSDEYVFQIRRLALDNATLNLSLANHEAVTVEKAGINIKNIGMDPTRGMRFDAISFDGVFVKNGDRAGSFNMSYNKAYRDDEVHMTFTLNAKNVDLNAVSFLYADSLPVYFQKGAVTLSSKTKLVNEAIESANTISLKDHTVSARNNSQMVAGIPLPMVCDALNKVNPAKLKFNITGSIDSPKFSGFEESLMNIIKPYLTDVAENLKKQAVSKLQGLMKKEPSEGKAVTSGEDNAAQAVDALKSIFGNK